MWNCTNYNHLNCPNKFLVIHACQHAFFIIILVGYSFTSTVTAAGGETDSAAEDGAIDEVTEVSNQEFDTATTCPSFDTNAVVVDPPPDAANDYIRIKTELATAALKNGDVKLASYYFAKLDEVPMAVEILQRIISDNYTSGLFESTMEFVNNVFNSSLRLEGYKILLDSILSDDNFSISRGELFRLAHQLKFQALLYSPTEFQNLTHRFSQGIRAVVFEPSFSIKNIHDSYVVHYKQQREDDRAWAYTGKCKHCEEGKLVAMPNHNFTLFTIKNVKLHNGKNCLGVSNSKAIFWYKHEDYNRFCVTENWQIRFVGKTLAKMVYQPVILEGVHDTDVMEAMEAARGFGLTRTGFNKKVELQSTAYLNSNQIWLTT